MIAVNDLASLKGGLGTDALQPLTVLLSPYAPHLAEELWATADGQGSVLDASWPQADDAFLAEDQITYPISFNGKVRFQLALAASLSSEEVEAAVRQDNRTDAQLAGKVGRGGRVVGVSVSAQNMADATITYLQDVLNVLVDCGTGVDYRQVFSTDNVGIGSWPSHNTGVWRYQPSDSGRYLHCFIVCLHISSPFARS